jgi:Mg-chelatase subunit ChlD
MRRHSLIVLLVLVSVASHASEQPGAEPPPIDVRGVERVRLDDVHPGVGGESVVDLHFRALTERGDPVEGLRLADVEVREDLRPVAKDDILGLTTLEDTGLGVGCVLALDTSRTMIGRPFERAKSAAVGFLENLGREDRVAIVSFGSAVEVVASFTDDRGDAVSRLGALEIDRNAMSTVLFDGVHRAVDLVRRGHATPRRAFVIVFSDGRDGGSRHSLDQVIALAKGSENEPRIAIFTVGYAGRGGTGLETLAKLAAATGGRSSRISDRTGFYEDTLLQMRHGYVLRYRSDMDGSPHIVEVVVEGKPDSRGVAYPKIRPAMWRWPVAAGSAVIVLLVVRALTRSRSPGSLRVVDGALEEERIPLRKGRTRIGSLPDNDIVIETLVVSRNHAEIRAGRSKVEIADLQSTNGTLVNGVPVGRRPLQPGDRIRIGEVEMVFER